MKKSLAGLAGVLTLAALAGVPNAASAESLTFVCQPSAEPAPAQWFGGVWRQPITVRVESISKLVELYDQEGNMLGGTLRASRLAGLGNYEFDMKFDENVIHWGVARMWATSGYIDRKSGRIDVLWTNEDGHNEETLTRQFHGTCRRR
jgi:hypothetical protein